MQAFASEQITSVQLFANPQAGWRARRRVAALRRHFLASGVTVLDAGHGSEPLVIDERAQHVCCAGGDGTLRLVLAALIQSGREMSVSVYPNGTVNLVARETGYPSDQEAFVRRVLRGNRRTRHYVGMIGDVPMASCASVGPDSHAVAAVSPFLKRIIGRAAYAVAACGFLIRWPRLTLTLSSAKRRMTCEAVYIAKGRFFAGPWSLAPTASLRAPEFHVIAVRDGSRTTFARICWSLLRGLPIEAVPGVETFTCSRLGIACAEAAPFQSDGDVVGDLPLQISLRHEPIEFA